MKKGQPKCKVKLTWCDSPHTMKFFIPICYFYHAPYKSEEDFTGR